MGEIRVYYYQNGLPDGPVYFYDSTKTRLTQSGFFKKDKYHGTWVEFHENGQIASIIEFDNGKVISDYQRFYASGQLKARYQAPYGRTPIGSFKEYYESGSLKSTGVYDTVRCDCLIDQKLMDEFSIDSRRLVNSIKVGKWTDYYENGNFKQQYEFKRKCFLSLELDTIETDLPVEPLISGKTVLKDCPSGKWILYKEDGTMLRTIEHKHCAVKKE